jgi:RNA polymerase sigma factor (sigma-70 family)
VANLRSETILKHFRTLMTDGSVTGMSDAELLGRFVTRQGEIAGVAFAAIVARHGPMVWGACRPLLSNQDDTEDAFQTTFLVLASKACWIRSPERLGPWLYGVARRAAQEARLRNGQRRRHEAVVARAQEKHLACESGSHDVWSARREEFEALHEEIARLPRKYSEPIIFCHLEGLTHAEAARRLGWPIGTVSVRLLRARELLRTRLTRRGLAPAFGLLALGLAPTAMAAVPAPLIEATAQAATRLAIGRVAAGAAIGALAEKVLQVRSGLGMRRVIAFLFMIGGIVAVAGAIAQPAPRPRVSGAPAEISARVARVAQRPANRRPDLSTPEATVRSFLAALNRADLKGAVAFVDGGRPGNAATWIEEMMHQQGYSYACSDLHVKVEGDVAAVRATTSLRSTTRGGRAIIGSKEEELRLRREGRDWRIVPGEKTSKNAARYGALQTYAMMLARDGPAAARRRASDMEADQAHVKALATAMGRVVQDQGGTFALTADSFKAALRPYLAGEDVYRCPSESGREMAYAFNGRLHGLSRSAIKDPAGTVMIYHGRGGQLEFCHGVATVAFVDGSVRQIPPLGARSLRWVP